MAYSFSDPQLEKDLNYVATTYGNSKVAILRRLIEAEKKRIRRRLEVRH